MFACLYFYAHNHLFTSLSVFSGSTLTPFRCFISIIIIMILVAVIFLCSNLFSFFLPHSNGKTGNEIYKLISTHERVCLCVSFFNSITFYIYKFMKNFANKFNKSIKQNYHKFQKSACRTSKI